MPVLGGTGQKLGLRANVWQNYMQDLEQLIPSCRFVLVSVRKVGVSVVQWEEFESCVLINEKPDKILI